MLHHPEFIKRICSYLQTISALDAQQSSTLAESFEDKSALEFESFLIQEALVSKDVLLQALSAVYNVTSFDASGFFFDHRLLVLFDKEFLQRTCCIPLSVEDNEILTLVAAVPNTQSLSEAVNNYGSWDVVYMVGLYRDIQDAIEEYYDDALTSDLIGELSDQQIYDNLINPQDTFDDMQAIESTDDI